MPNYKSIIAYLGQSRKFTLPEEVYISGFANYTPDVIKKLRKLFDAKIIDSYPTINKSGAYVEWNDEKGREHRNMRDLPSTEWWNGEKVWKVENVQTRDTGPSWIDPEKTIIQWTDKNGNHVAQEDGVLGTQHYRVIDPMGEWRVVKRQEYEDFIRERFPLAGNKMHFEDWHPPKS